MERLLPMKSYRRRAFQKYGSGLGIRKDREICMLYDNCLLYTSYILSSFLIIRQLNKENGRFLVPMRLGDTPVPIPNTMVKTLSLIHI